MPVIWLFVCALVALGGCKDRPERKNPPKSEVFPRDQAYEVALTLAALRDRKDTAGTADRDLVDRHRLAVGSGLQVYRRYTVAKNSSATTIMLDELRHALHEHLKTPLVPGQIVDLLESTPHTLQVVAALLDPDARVFERTEQLTGANRATVEDQLRQRLEVDVIKRTIRGAPWANVDKEAGYWGPLVVDKVTEPGMQIALRDALLLEPTAKLGEELKLRTVVTRAPDAPRLHPEPALQLNFEASAFEHLRGLTRPIGTMETPVGKLPLRRFYTEAYGVQYVEVPRADALALWKHLDAEAPKSGLRPLVYAGTDAQLTYARIAWLPDRDPLMEQAAMHPSHKPQVALAAIDSVDVPALLKPGGNPSYPDRVPAHGPMPPPSPGNHELVATREEDFMPEYRVILIVQTEAAWKGPAFVRGFLDAGESTPSLAQAAAVSRHWENKYGAHLAAIGPAKLEWYLTRKLTKQEALVLANELLVFAPDSYGDATVEEVAARMLADVSFDAWWD